MGLPSVVKCGNRLCKRSNPPFASGNRVNWEEFEEDWPPGHFLEHLVERAIVNRFSVFDVRIRWNHGQCRGQAGPDHIGGT
ncbi:MAG: hypothetical protein ACI8TQ_000833 [Planctomycetota bacterium]|jgi:hypothetical protein